MLRNSEKILERFTVLLTIVVYGEHTIMSFIRCTINWTYLK